MPNMYARGILWGKMFLELGDSCTAKNEQTGHCAEIQFKTKVRRNLGVGRHRVLIVCALLGLLLRDVQRDLRAHTPRQL